MRRYLYIYVAFALTMPALFGQEGPGAAPHPQPATTTQTPNTDEPADPVQEPAARPGELRDPAKPAQRTPPRQTRPAPAQAYGYRQPERPPAAQYSPLAAQGGYCRHQSSPWQMVVGHFNPRHLNLGHLMEERRQAWLDNVATNEYFWYAACATGMLLISWTVLWWVNDDRLRALTELSENAADALRYSEYCKREAKAAIRRHNEHMDKCNRVIEDQRSGLATTPETAHLDDQKREIKRLAADNDALKKHNARLLEEREQKAAELQTLTQRVDEVEKHLQASNGASKNPNTGLVERIARLEDENRRLQQQLTRKANTKTTILNGEPNSGE
jgi:hypothetical protein